MLSVLFDPYPLLVTLICIILKLSSVIRSLSLHLVQYEAIRCIYIKLESFLFSRYPVIECLWVPND